MEEYIILLEMAEEYINFESSKKHGQREEAESLSGLRAELRERARTHNKAKRLSRIREYLDILKDPRRAAKYHMQGRSDLHGPTAKARAQHQGLPVARWAAGVALLAAIYKLASMFSDYK